jgi:hypothetical protein
VTAPSAPNIGDPCWHVHHGEGILFEYLTEPYEVRQKFIRENKPAAEVETRLRLFQPVRGTISPPKYWQEAYAKWQEADAKWRKADAKWRSEPSWQVVLDLHAKECPNCPWDGKTIFPEAKQ